MPENSYIARSIFRRTPGTAGRRMKGERTWKKSFLKVQPREIR